MTGMNIRLFSVFFKIIGFTILCGLLINPVSARPTSQSSASVATDTPCRFGITSIMGSDGYDISSLGIGSYLDWGAVNNPNLPAGVEYIHVLRLRDDLYDQTRASLPTWVDSNLGSVWVVGNEPDTRYGNQDALLPEVYADRYYELAQIIRQHDQTAQIAFGPIVQPTPIRIRYLERAWNRLKVNAGSASEASKLIDIWSIHSFILNEDTTFGNTWGTGVPPGFEDEHNDAFIIDPQHFYYTYSSSIFQQRIFDFRAWLASIGERNKPLWITEYGSLFPPVDPIGGMDYVNVSDANTASYMLDTFNFLLDGSDSQIGMPADGNQLVQRWFWYSLNDHRYRFGGSIYNPDYPDYSEYGDSMVTPVGDSFIAYQASHLVQPDLIPTGLTIAPKSYNQDRTLINYRLVITVDNNQFYDASCTQLRVYDGNPESGGRLIAKPLSASAIKANYGSGTAVIHWMGVKPLVKHTLYVVVDPIGVTDIDPGNNEAHFEVYLEPLELNFLPLLQMK